MVTDRENILAGLYMQMHIDTSGDLLLIMELLNQAMQSLPQEHKSELIPAMEHIVRSRKKAQKQFKEFQDLAGDMLEEIRQANQAGEDSTLEAFKDLLDGSDQDDNQAE